MPEPSRPQPNKRAPRSSYRLPTRSNGSIRKSSLGRAAGFARDDPPVAKLEKLEALLARAAPPDEDVAFLADLLSMQASGRNPLPDLSPPRNRNQMSPC